MSADTNPGGNFTDVLRKKFSGPDQLSSPVEGIQASPLQRIQTTNIEVRFVVAEDGNPWGYDAGAYLVTNLLPQAFEKTHGVLEATLSNYVMMQMIPLHPSYEANVALTPRYTGPNGGVIFQLNGRG